MGTMLNEIRRGPPVQWFKLQGTAAATGIQSHCFLQFWIGPPPVGHHVPKEH